MNLQSFCFAYFLIFVVVVGLLSSLQPFAKVLETLYFILA